MTQNFPDNTLYEMDNIDVLRGMNSQTVDLIATDPPFNTKRNRSATAGHYVDNWNRKERERLEKVVKDGSDPGQLDKQTQKYEMHYQTKPPTRTDQNEQTLPELAHVYPIETEYRLSHAEMHEILTEQFGLKCWGCNFIPPDKRYLHLDHIIPKSDGGTNDIDNRALLCQPCNTKKSNTMSLNALRKQNKREGYMQSNSPMDLQNALAWTRNYLIQTIRETPDQLKINNMYR